MSGANTNYPTRDAPYITRLTLEAAREGHLAHRLRELCICPDRKAAEAAVGSPLRIERCLYCEAEAQLGAQAREVASWKAVAHDHSERLKILTAKHDDMRAHLAELQKASCAFFAAPAGEWTADTFSALEQLLHRIDDVLRDAKAAA